MEHDDSEYVDMLNEKLKDVEPDAGLHGKVRDGIARNVVRLHRRNTALGAVAIAVVLTMALSTVTPVFGRNGTLPQVIAAMAAERQAEKMSRTLGSAPVQQTGTALQTSVVAVQAVSDSALSETDGILALVVSERASKPVEDVLAMRTDGLGWGLIMTQLDVSGRDVGEAMSQAERVAVASSPSAASQGKETSSKPAAGNRDGDKIVVSGQITGVSTNSITVEGKTFAIVVETQLKYHGKAITTADVTVKLTAGKLYATVQGTKLSETTFRANVIVVQDTLGEAQQEQEREQSQEHANDIQQQIRGNVTFVSSALLQISGFVPGIVLNADTKVEQVGAGTMDLAGIKLGQSVQVHVFLSGTTYTAQQVHIEDKYVRPDTASGEDNDSQGTQPASNEQQARGKVTAVTATTLRIDGYAHDIVLTASSKVEQAGAGKSTITDIKVGQTVQVHVSLTGTTYTATQVHIEDKYVKPDKEANGQPTDISVTTWQGTVSGVFVQPGVNSASEQTIGVVVLTASGQQPTLYWILPTSVVQDTSSHTLTLAALQTLQGTAAQKVTIQGRLLADGTVDIVRIVLTTDTGANPGKGNGKH